MTTPTIPRAANGLPRIDSQGYFHAASDEYEAALAEFADQQLLVAEQKAALGHVREELKDIEATVLANGGHGKYVIDTGNAERRAAMLRAALADHQPYAAKRGEVTTAERELAKAETARDHIANVMALMRRRMDMSITATQRAAALLMYGPRQGESPSERQ